MAKGEKKIGNMLYSIATKLPVHVEKYREMLAKNVGSKGIYNPNQLDYAIEYLVTEEKKGGVNIEKFNKVCGVGVHHTPEEVSKLAADTIKDANETSDKWGFFNTFKSKIPYVEGKVLK